jgi:hypothetical protein
MCATPQQETTCEVVLGCIKNAVGNCVDFGRVNYAHYLCIYSLLELARQCKATYNSIDGHNLTEDDAGEK